LPVLNTAEFIQVMTEDKPEEQMDETQILRKTTLKNFLKKELGTDDIT
jgi:hypothetical protein